MVSFTQSGLFVKVPPGQPGRREESAAAGVWGVGSCSYNRPHTTPAGHGLSFSRNNEQKGTLGFGAGVTFAHEM